MLSHHEREGYDVLDANRAMRERDDAHAVVRCADGLVMATRKGVGKRAADDLAGEVD